MLFSLHTKIKWVFRHCLRPHRMQYCEVKLSLLTNNHMACVYHNNFRKCIRKVHTWDKSIWARLLLPPGRYKHSDVTVPSLQEPINCKLHALAWEDLLVAMALRGTQKRYWFILRLITLAFFAYPTLSLESYPPRAIHVWIRIWRHFSKT